MRRWEVEKEKNKTSLLFGVQKVFGRYKKVAA